MSFGLRIASFCSKMGKLLGLGSFWWLRRLWKAKQACEVSLQKQTDTSQPLTLSFTTCDPEHLSPEQLASVTSELAAL